jgi:hypothetical protein
MIVFDLACAQGHRFEGWFASGDEFARQRGESLVRCPVCDDAAIDRLPSARVSVPKPALPAAQPSHPPEPEPRASVAGGLPAEVVKALREMVRSTENVGPRFPEEARRIHYQEAPARAIRGKATAEEAEALRDEGIEFAPLPDFLAADSH